MKRMSTASGFKCYEGFARADLTAKVGDAFMLEDGNEAVGRLLLIKTKLHGVALGELMV